jgi:hypothetical protein
MDEPRLILPDRELPARRLHQRREHLVQEITTSRHGVRPLVLVLAAAALMLAATGFGAYALTREPTHVDSIGCFERADVRASVTVIGSDATDPVARCAALWRSGVIGSRNEAPPLTPCVLDTGAIAVMPGGAGVCEALGIASLSAESRSRLARLGGLHAELATRFGDGSGSKKRTACVGEADARGIVRRELDARGLTDWTVDVAVPFDADRRCASASLVPAETKVQLIPLGR